jgi:virginiamycin A acetyltransferase
MSINFMDLARHPSAFASVGRYSSGAVISPERHAFPPLIQGPNISVGSFCSFAQGSAVISAYDHPIQRVSTFCFESLEWGNGGLTQDAPKDPYVRIGNDVWLGYNAVVLQCVTVGDGAVIGAGAVVTKDVEPYTIVTRVPARPLKKRFTDEQIEALLEIKWWDWPDDVIKENADLIQSSHIDMFIDQARRLKEQGRV